jgi:hypothetical protein
MPLDLHTFITSCVKHAHTTRSAKTKLTASKTKPLTASERAALEAEERAKQVLETFREQLRIASMKDKAIVLLEIHSHCQCGVKYIHPNEYIFVEREGTNGALHKEALISSRHQISSLLYSYRHLTFRREEYHIHITHCSVCFPITETEASPQYELPLEDRPHA